MNKLKWYDFLGALLLLFSVTKAAINPPETKDYTNTLLAPPASTNTHTIALSVAPREAALSQIDMLNSSMSGNLITPEVQVEMVKGVHGDVLNVASNSIAKAIPKSAPRAETYPDQKDNISLGLRAPASSFAPVFND